MPKKKKVTPFTDQWGNKRTVRTPGNAYGELEWFETWLTPIRTDLDINACKVMVYDQPEVGWTGYPYSKDGTVHRNTMLHVWPKWCWKMVLGPTSDIPSPPPITIEESQVFQPVVRHDQFQFPLDPEQESTAQERIALSNYKETLRFKKHRNEEGF